MTRQEYFPALILPNSAVKPFAFLTRFAVLRDSNGDTPHLRWVQVEGANLTLYMTWLYDRTYVL